MEEQHRWCNILSVRKSRPGLCPLDSQSPSLPPFTPSAKDVHVTVQTLALSDLWLCGYRKRIKWIACMCSLFIANTNEKWAHPLSLGFSLLAHFLSPDTTASPFLKVKHLERVTVTTQPQEKRVSAPKDHADLEKTLRTRTAVGDTAHGHKILYT